MFWIGTEPSHFFSQAMMMYVRAFGAKHTVTAHPFMPKLLRTQARLAIKLLKISPKTIDLVYVTTQDVLYRFLTSFYIEWI